MAIRLDQIAILIVTHNRPDLAANSLAAVFSSPDAPPPANVMVVDNSTNQDTLDLLTSRYRPLPYLHLGADQGSVAGANSGFRFLRRNRPQVKYVALLGQGVTPKPGWLEALVQCAEANPDTAILAPRLLFPPPATPYILAGYRSHYLGFRLPLIPADPEQGCDIDAPSALAMLIRVDAVFDRELFDESYAGGCETTELGWYVRVRGMRSVYCPASTAEFPGEVPQDNLHCLAARNRCQLLLTYYRWPTLILLIPVLLLSQIASFLSSPGSLRTSPRPGSSVFRPGLLRLRPKLQHQRRVTDHRFTLPFAGRVDSSAPLLLRLANPLLLIYWKAAQLLLWW